MRKPQSVRALEELGRVRLSKRFFMRDFLYSEIANYNGLQNSPDDSDLAIAAGKRLCESLLEPLADRFGHIAIRSSYRSKVVNRFGNENKLNCSRNEANYAGHIWDERDADGHMGATACIIVTSFIDYYEATGRWQALAWWVHDSLPYHNMQFFPRYAAFNLTFREAAEPSIYSYIPQTTGWLTKPDMANATGDHASEYADWLATLETP